MEAFQASGFLVVSATQGGGAAPLTLGYDMLRLQRKEDDDAVPPSRDRKRGFPTTRSSGGRIRAPETMRKAVLKRVDVARAPGGLPQAGNHPGSPGRRQASARGSLT